MEKQAAVKVRNLTAGYGENIILRDISFDVYAGEVFVILGGSGCGKSTLLRHLVGLNKPLEGEVFIEDVPINACDEVDFQKTLKKIGILFQGGALFGSMTVSENVSLPITDSAELTPGALDALVKMKLRMVNLSGYENHMPSELSGGMKKRAGLARALALNPQIIFLDEPSAGLDPITSAEIDQLILHINKSIGTTIIIVTHELDSIFTVAQRVIMLDKSTQGIIAQGDPRELKKTSDNQMVRQFFHRQPKPDLSTGH